MRRFFQLSITGLTFLLGIALFIYAGFVLPWILQEILHPAGSFGRPINRLAVQLAIAAIAIAATLEVLLLSVLLSQHWIRRALAVNAMLIYSGIVLLSILGIFILQY